MLKIKQFLYKNVYEILATGLLLVSIFWVHAAFKAIPAKAAQPVHVLASPHKNDMRAASVMITNREQTSGGTGVIVLSTPSESYILTNDHVCRLVKENGGLVSGVSGTFQIDNIRESESSDLCIVAVLTDLHQVIELSPTPPKPYENSYVSGHPALMPNVISKGHFSGRSIVQVMTGFKKCSDDEATNPDTGLICAFFGGLPIVKSYESMLVSSTIMPGSSGSGVYNDKEELSGLVFAGSSGFGYGWIVPYEQVVRFLTQEVRYIPAQHISQEVNLFGKGNSSKFKEVIRKCANLKPDVDETVDDMCKVISHNALWFK